MQNPPLLVGEERFRKTTYIQQYAFVSSYHLCPPLSREIVHFNRPRDWLRIKSRDSITIQYNHCQTWQLSINQCIASSKILKSQAVAEYYKILCVDNTVCAWVRRSYPCDCAMGYCLLHMAGLGFVRYLQWQLRQWVTWGYCDIRYGLVKILYIYEVGTKV